MNSVTPHPPLDAEIAAGAARLASACRIAHARDLRDAANNLDADADAVIEAYVAAEKARAALNAAERAVV